MKRTMELVSFVSFVFFVMWIIVSGVSPQKNTIYRSVEKSSAKFIYPPNKAALFNPGLQTSNSLNFITRVGK